MRPLASSSCSIEGMLFATLVWRRAPQNPSVIVTACTGTLCSLAYGDLSTKSTPSSFQLRSDEPGPLCPEKAISLWSGREPIAVTEIAEPTNARRDICDLLVMLSSSELLNIETFPASDAQIRGMSQGARPAWWRVDFVRCPRGIPARGEFRNRRLLRWPWVIPSELVRVRV